jgi:hypothetical protein
MGTLAAASSTSLHRSSLLVIWILTRLAERLLLSLLAIHASKLVHHIGIGTHGYAIWLPHVLLIRHVTLHHHSIERLIHAWHHAHPRVHSIILWISYRSSHPIVWSVLLRRWPALRVPKHVCLGFRIHWKVLSRKLRLCLGSLNVLRLYKGLC